MKDDVPFLAQSNAGVLIAGIILYFKKYFRNNNNFILFLKKKSISVQNSFLQIKRTISVFLLKCDKNLRKSLEIFIDLKTLLSIYRIKKTFGNIFKKAF